MGAAGLTGNVTVKNDYSPPLFYIHNNQLWNFHNASTIYPVNVVNATQSSQLPLQIVVGKAKGDVVKGGSWRWQGTMLFYEYGSAHNSGVYYSCQDTNGFMGLFLFLKGWVSLLILSAAPRLTCVIRIPGRQLRQAAPYLQCIVLCVLGSSASVRALLYLRCRLSKKTVYNSLLVHSITLCRGHAHHLTRLLRQSRKSFSSGRHTCGDRPTSVSECPHASRRRRGRTVPSAPSRLRTALSDALRTEPCRTPEHG